VLTVVIPGVLRAVPGFVVLAGFRVVVVCDMLGTVTLAAIIGAFAGAPREFRRFRTIGTARRRCRSAACNSDLQRRGRRGKTKDDIRSVGDLWSVCYAYASHVQMPEIRIDFFFLVGIKMCRTLVKKQDFWSAIEGTRKQYSLFLPAR
jgi:hypothetical protein